MLMFLVLLVHQIFLLSYKILIFRCSNSTEIQMADQVAEEVGHMREIIWKHHGRPADFCNGLLRHANAENQPATYV